MTKPLNLSKKTIAKILRRLGNGEARTKVAADHGISVHGMMRNVDPEYRQQDRERMRTYMIGRRPPSTKGSHKNHVRHRDEENPIVLPPARFTSLSAQIMGDPPIGRSALDAKFTTTS